ncbi:HlyD family secretion protein [Thermostichus sp. MS-CIW-21]|uniref:efflux RND transporter periplasmic adaptor subunit n=1 Tax=unclassified Synechococcus TaxID=2626047 RepID=UPI00006944AE|nr:MULTISPECIES: efflux RND transporter periplasmic adaptor subunit [unclassified Synechococcus]ABC99780.1 efflux transporter, RND family, MFP subunit [Synechococcus sp. JA-3-3Ab]PIK87281.1 RND transporter [Synechococcus sp. 63AY4M2]PIK88204.1 RND transporter [Synechococcus sp. 65AY6A5]PIK92636.1 RND transporter [Synechococcus sp. 65AY6Li]PIK93993.1 RND transporter [Synechococcus sp. 60AY4M2]
MILRTNEPQTGSPTPAKSADQPLPQTGSHNRGLPIGWILVGILLAGLGGGILVQRQLRQQTAQRLERLTVPVQVTDLAQRLRVSGQVQPIRQVNVSPRESGRLAELLVDQGDEVVAGQVLARMDYGDLASGIRQAQARIQELQARLAELQAGERPQVIAAAQARVDAARSQVRLAERELERIQTLVQQGVVARSELDQRLARLEQAQADWQAAQQELERLRSGSRPETLQQIQAQIAQAEAELAQRQSRLAEAEIRAPFSGVVVQRFAEVGSFVTPTTAASDATAASSSSILALAQGIEVRAEVPEAQIAQVRVGQPVEIRSLAYPDRVVQGRVKRIAPATVVVREVTVFRVMIEPEAGADFLRTGMNVSVDFIGERQPQALTVPSVAILREQGQEGVILLDPRTQRPVYRPVETGLTQGGITQVLSGLRAGDRVFTALPPGVNLETLIRQEQNRSETAQIKPHP